MRKRCSLLLMSIAIFFVVGCETKDHTTITPNEPIQSNALHDYIETLQSSRLSSGDPTKTLSMFQDLPYDYDAYMDALQYVLDHAEQSTSRTAISYHDAQIDTDQLFTMFEILYGGYPAYDQQLFIDAKQSILDQVDACKTLTRTKFARIIIDALSFLQDDHLRINGEGLNKGEVTYYEDIQRSEQVFTKEDDEYYRIGYEDAIIAINDDDQLDSYLKPYVQDDGTIAYHLYIHDQEERSDVTITLANDEVIEIPVIQEEPYTNTGIYEEETIEGIPYIYIGAMVYQKSGEEQAQIAEAFIESAKKIKEQPVAILDLRDNYGGNAMLSYEWSYRFTGEKRAGLGTRILRMPLEDKRYIQIGDEETVQSLKDLSDYADFQKYQDGLYVEFQEETLVDNNTILFVLQDENSVSAAEMLIDQLHTVRNVIFVGMPTRGAVQSSAMIPCYMEQTGLKVQFGNLYGIFDPSYIREYHGIQPDIWVPSQQALDYTIQLIQAVGLR